VHVSRSILNEVRRGETPRPAPASSSVKPAARRVTGALPNQIGIKVTVARSYAAILPESASLGLYFPGTARPHGNYETVPGIDCRDCQRQIGEFLFREMLVCLLKDFVGSMILLDVCDGFRRAESGALPLAVIRRFSPGIQAIEPLFASPAARKSFQCMSMQ